MEAKNGVEKQNAALRPFAALIGEWNTSGTHPYLPDQTFHGKTSFEWHEGGAFLIQRQMLEDPRFPKGVAILGSDDVAQTFYLLYFDDRGISRKYDVSFEKNVMTWHRDEPHFSQRMVFSISDDGKTISSKGEMRKDGGAWEPDLQLTYVRQ